MAAESSIGPPGIDRDLDVIFAGIEALRDLASDPDKAKDGARVYDFNVRWGTLMSGRLMRLEHYYRAVKLTGEQERRYRELRREFENVAPAIESLGVTRPTVPLQD